MGIDKNSKVGPVVVCIPNGKKSIPLWDFPEERMNLIMDEGEEKYFVDNHVYEPNFGNYYINLADTESSFYKLNHGYICDILTEFETDFKNDIDFLENYYGKGNIEIVVAAYGYYS
jgi:hypothetical protein